MRQQTSGVKHPPQNELITLAHSLPVETEALSEGIRTRWIVCCAVAKSTRARWHAAIHASLLAMKKFINKKLTTRFTWPLTTATQSCISKEGDCLDKGSR